MVRQAIESAKNKRKRAKIDEFIDKPLKKAKVCQLKSGIPTNISTNTKIDSRYKKAISSEIKRDSTEIVASGEITKKKKRPWRAKVRREARKARLEAERADREAREPANKPLDPVSKDKKKKKHKKKKKFVDSTVTPDEVSEKEGKLDKAILNSASHKLEASRFRYLNEQLYTSTSSDAEKLFQDDPDAFEAYHKGYRIQMTKWPANPLDIIIRDLETLSSGSVIADLGCGEAKLSEKLASKHTVHSYDLVAKNDRVIACNIAKLPLENGSVDVTVFCLSLMGTNLSDYIREAHRVLKKGGKLKIAEVTSRFRNVKYFILALEKMGFQLKRKKDLESYFTLLTLEKIGKITEKRPKGLILDPCLYKKR